MAPKGPRYIVHLSIDALPAHHPPDPRKPDRYSRLMGGGGSRTEGNQPCIIPATVSNKGLTKAEGTASWKIYRYQLRLDWDVLDCSSGCLAINIYRDVCREVGVEGEG